jgi:hypothetical protein
VDLKANLVADGWERKKWLWMALAARDVRGQSSYATWNQLHVGKVKDQMRSRFYANGIGPQLKADCWTD